MLVQGVELRVNNTLLFPNEQRQLPTEQKAEVPPTNKPHPNILPFLFVVWKDGKPHPCTISTTSVLAQFQDKKVRPKRAVGTHLELHRNKRCLYR